MARILSIANELDILKTRQENQPFAFKTKDSIETYFQRNSEKTFDPELVSRILDIELLNEPNPDKTEKIINVRATSLEEGMILAANVLTKNRLLILPKGEVLDAIKIKRIKNFYCSYGIAEDNVQVILEN